MDLKPLRGLVGDVQTFAVALWREEDVVLDARVHGLRKGGVKIDARGTAGELPGAGVLKPVLRGLCGVEGDSARAVLHCNIRFDTAGAVQIASIVDGA